MYKKNENQNGQEDYFQYSAKKDGISNSIVIVDKYILCTKFRTAD